MSKLVIKDMSFFSQAIDQLIDDFNANKPVTGPIVSPFCGGYTPYAEVRHRCLVIDAYAEAELRKAIDAALHPGEFVVTALHVVAGRFGFELRAIIEEDTRVSV
ncbi:hypothetical protein D5W64_13165 [Salmonella enterica subsp. enterica serovar Saintpaul]|nr:hypothetical protein [Salmonella enterica subsp. enterica serovar Saintpaul]